MSHLLQLRALLTDLRIVLALCVAVMGLVFHVDRRVDGQEPPVETPPVVTLVGVPYPDVREGSTLRITVKIDPSVKAGDPGVENGRLTGGIIVWDPADSEVATSLIALAFYPGDDTDDVTYTVADDGVVTTDRKVRIAINSVFDVYTVGDPSETTVRVLDRSTAPPPPPPIFQPGAGADTYSHTHSYSDTHPHSYPYANPNPNSHAHTDTYTEANSDANANTDPRAGAYTHADADSHPDAYSDTHAYSDAYPHTDSHVYAYAHTDSHTFPRAHAGPAPHRGTHANAHADTDRRPHRRRARTGPRRDAACHSGEPGADRSPDHRRGRSPHSQHSGGHRLHASTGAPRSSSSRA